MTSQPSITIGELEANYQLYCKALKMLIAEKRSLPRHYKSPEYLYAQLLQQLQAVD